MGSKLARWLTVVTPLLVICLWPTCAGAVAITLPEVVELAFQRNAQYQLEVWEHELALKEQELKNQKLTLNFSSMPFQLKDGRLQPSKGSILLTAPLSENTTLTGNLTVQSTDPEFTGALNIKFKYDFFAAQAAGPATETDPMLAVANNLVLDVATAFVNLVKEREKLAFEGLRLAYLKEAYQAAVVTDNQNQISMLKQQVYESEKRSASLQISIRQHHQQLNRLLNMETPVDYEPVLTVKAETPECDQSQLAEWALNASNLRSQAAAAVAEAERKLEAAKKASGWSVSADANFDWAFGTSQQPTWSVSVTASKTLYPPSLQEEKDALSLAKAQLHLEEVELNIHNQVAQLWEQLINLQAQHQDLEADLQSAEADLEAARKLYTVGLATELKLKEHQLELARLETNLRENRYDYLTTLLKLYNLCGFELAAVIPELVD